MDVSLRCDFLIFRHGAWSPCHRQATYMYRYIGDPEAIPGYRCGEDVAWLDRSVVTVEEIGGESA